MFRTHQHPQTDKFDMEKIQHHIATINFLADALRYSTQRHHINSHLAVLQHAINTFEKHRFSDYQLNETKRAEQVLHTRNIFKELYKHELKKMDSSILARALKHELRDYATSVKGIISAIQEDLSASLQNKFDAEQNDQTWNMLEQELNQFRVKNAVVDLADAIYDFDESNDEYGYFILSDDETVELEAKPYLRGNTDFFDEATQPLLDDQDNYTSDDEAEYEASELSDTDIEEESASTSEDSSPAASPALSHSRLFRFHPQMTRSVSSSDSDSELDIDNSPVASRRKNR